MCVLAALMLTGCLRNHNWLNFQVLPDVKLEKISSNHIKSLPLYLNAINDSLVYFLNEFESVMIWNTKTGAHSGTIIPLMNIPKFLKEEVNLSDTIEMYDLKLEKDPFFKTYPNYYLHNAFIKGELCHLIVFVNNPLISRGIITIPYVPLLISTKLNGEVVEKSFIKLDSNILFTTNSGCIFFPEEKRLITSAISPNFYKVLTATLEYRDSQYSMVSYKKFPQFLDSIRNDMIKWDKPYQLIANCDFKMAGNDLLFSNNRDIYDHKTGKVIIPARFTPEDDTIRFIRTFVVIHNSRGKPKFIAYTESTYPDQILEFTTLADENNLIIRSLKTGKVVKKFTLGTKISGLALQGNQLVWIEENDDALYFKRIKFKL